MSTPNINTEITQGDNSIAVVENNTKNVEKTVNKTVEKTVNVEKTVTVDVAPLEAIQKAMLDELIAIRLQLQDIIDAGLGLS